MTSEKISSRKNESLVSGEAVGIVVVHDLEVIGVLIEILVDYTVKLSEIRQTCSAHPHDEMF